MDANGYFLKALGQNLKELRMLKCLSPKELANTIHISPQALGKIERGESYLSIVRLVQICYALQVKPDEVLRCVQYHSILNL